jgi:hypothetical protein
MTDGVVHPVMNLGVDIAREKCLMQIPGSFFFLSLARAIFLDLLHLKIVGNLVKITRLQHCAHGTLHRSWANKRVYSFAFDLGIQGAHGIPLLAKGASFLDLGINISGNFIRIAKAP